MTNSIKYTVEDLKKHFPEIFILIRFYDLELNVFDGEIIPIIQGRIIKQIKTEIISKRNNHRMN